MPAKRATPAGRSAYGVGGGRRRAAATGGGSKRADCRTFLDEGAVFSGDEDANGFDHDVVCCGDADGFTRCPFIRREIDLLYLRWMQKIGDSNVER